MIVEVMAVMAVVAVVTVVAVVVWWCYRSMAQLSHMVKPPPSS